MALAHLPTMLEHNMHTRRTPPTLMIHSDQEGERRPAGIKATKPRVLLHKPTKPLWTKNYSDKIDHQVVPEAPFP
jgi:hypothetical protein